MRVDPLDGGHVAQQTVPRVAHNIDQQPGDRICIEGIDVGHSFAGDLTSVSQPPGGTCGMMSDYFVFAIVQIRVGALEGPAELAVRGGLASVDLRSGRVRVYDNL